MIVINVQPCFMQFNSLVTKLQNVWLRMYGKNDKIKTTHILPSVGIIIAYVIHV